MLKVGGATRAFRILFARTDGATPIVCARFGLGNAEGGAFDMYKAEIDPLPASGELPGAPRKGL